MDRHVRGRLVGRQYISSKQDYASLSYHHVTSTIFFDCQACLVLNSLIDAILNKFMTMIMDELTIRWPLPLKIDVLDFQNFDYNFDTPTIHLRNFKKFGRSLPFLAVPKPTYINADSFEVMSLKGII